MHIALIGSRSSIHVVRWANSLYKRGFKITLFTMHEKKDNLLEGINVIELPFKNPYGYILNIPYLRSKLKELAPDLVHSMYAFGHSFLARMAAYKPHIVSVFGSDIYDDTEKNFIYKRIVKDNILKADVVCSTSNVMGQRIKEVIEREININITPFGVDIQRFDKIEGCKKDKSEFVIGTVKKLEDKYGVDVLIKSFALFVDKYPKLNTRLIIVGEGSKKQELVLLAKELEVLDKCEFIGFVKYNEVPIWLQKMHVFMELSRLISESFGVSVIEAMACKLPVIVSNVGGLKEVVDDKKTGIIIPNENYKVASEKIEYLFKNSNIAAELGENARTKVLSEYSWKSSLDIMIDIYQGL
mgnify:CR=1 FL=1